MPDPTTKRYLGDSVYVDVNDWGALVLTTENGLADDPTNIIVLEPVFYDALVEYVEQRREERNG